LNTYGYVEGNPLINTDFFGLDTLRTKLLSAIGRGDTKQIRSLLDSLSDPKMIKQAKEALDKFGSKADDWIQAQCKGSVREEFPSKMLDKTLEEIRKGSSRDAKKAWKLLNDNRFRK
jgi:hypothetical protein